MNPSTSEYKFPSSSKSESDKYSDKSSDSTISSSHTRSTASKISSPDNKVWRLKLDNDARENALIKAYNSGFLISPHTIDEMRKLSEERYKQRKEREEKKEAHN